MLLGSAVAGEVADLAERVFVADSLGGLRELDVVVIAPVGALFDVRHNQAAGDVGHPVGELQVFGLTGADRVGVDVRHCESLPTETGMSTVSADCGLLAFAASAPDRLLRRHRASSLKSLEMCAGVPCQTAETQTTSGGQISRTDVRRHNDALRHEPSSDLCSCGGRPLPSRGAPLTFRGKPPRCAGELRQERRGMRKHV